MINLDITDYTPEEMNEMRYQEDIAEEQLDRYIDSWFQKQDLQLNNSTIPVWPTDAQMVYKLGCCFFLFAIYLP